MLPPRAAVKESLDGTWLSHGEDARGAIDLVSAAARCRARRMDRARRPTGYHDAVAEMERAPPRSPPARPASASGCSSTRRSTPPAPRRPTTTCSAPTASRSIARAGAGSSPIMAPASAWPTSCSTCANAAATSAPSSRRWKAGSSTRSPPSTSAASAATAASASGCAVPTRGRPRGQDRRYRRPRLRWVTFHGISLNVSPTSSISTASSPAASPTRASTSLVELGLLVTLPEVDLVLRAEFERVFGDIRPRPKPLRPFIFRSPSLDQSRPIFRLE